ncbi:MAG: pantetheine-phosphate adenylyltransferase [Actinomycetaceae bacterium]|nr:pantetheine-phosphate adenylyltransferase [Actinomycetaceae bacterium]MDU0970072.1 pantetheine-phosphate adenylyltransferase [Actinomycetaceae bacterium]
MTTVLIPGSFDPPTLGHVALVAQARRLADRVVVAVAQNTAKRGMFPPAQRVDLLRQALADFDGVEVCLCEGLVVDLARQVGADALVKGVRGAVDTDNEIAQATLNRRLGGIDTFLVPTLPEWAAVSSSAVREIAATGGDVTEFVPEAVAAALATRTGEDHHDH